QSQIKTGPYPVSLTPELIDQAYEYYEKYGKTDISDKLNRIQPVPVGGTQYFWAMAPVSKQFYKVEAVLRKITEHCYIYVEKGQNINDDTIDKFAYEFDNIIYPTNHKYFGTEAKPGVDFDERLTMLFLDIKDGYDPATSPGYVAGYFFPLNQYSTKVFEYSNEREMIYIDTYPSDPSSQMTYSVIAHEFQHMQHWNMSPKEKIWINEACSQLAMRLCGYEHPNQILAYMKNPDLSLTAWAKDVMLENYGAVYLFFYYMVTKYFPKNYADFTLNLVKNQTPGVAGINEVLKKNGIKKTTEQIFEEWAITNVLNIEGTPYFYDKTISQMTLNPSKVHVADTAGKIKEKALSFGSHYIQFSYNVPFLPTFPSFIDKITIMDKEAVNIKWGVNNWNLPINDYIPQGSYIENSFIVTPLVNNGDKNKTEIGPFRKPGIQNIKTVNFVFEYKDGSISKPYEIPVCDPSFAENTGDTLKINFDGSGSFFGNIFGKPDFNVYIAKFDSADAKNTLKVEKIKLDSSKKSEILIENYGTLYDTVILIPLNTGKDGSYEYSSELISTSKSEKQITEIVEMLKKSAMNSFINNDIDNYLKILDRFEILKNSHNIDINPLISSKSDDSDTSHSNINYLLAKNHEALHALSHLKIDPVYVEGQLKQILQLLEINLNFPHIPFPDGLALKNYNIKTSLEFSDMLKNKTVTEKDKELLVRLTMAQNYIEQTYNMGLLLAEDTTLSIFKIILLFTHSTEIISGILDNFTDSPVLGSIAGPVKNMLIEKITIAFQRVIKLAASKMPSPYNSIVPVASDIMTKILFKVMKIEPSSNDGMSAGFMKELAVKTAGKYILSSIPKIGYVDLTQKNLENAVNYANSGRINGTLSNAAQKVQNNLST
ncbi:MAG: hypothetical protein WC337_11820, partial [Candidatus Muiribacteriota bacterium]